MKINKTVVFLAIFSSIMLTAAVGTSAQKIKYNYLPGTDFSKYKTYKWVRVEKAQYPNDILDQQLTSSIDRQLAQKGFTKIETGTPDMIAVYQASVNQQQQWNAYSTGGDYWGWGRWGGWGGWGGGMTSTTMTSSTINIGSLNLDFYDIATKKQLWRGVATKTLKDPKNPEKLQRNIDKAMAKLLKKFPPQPR